MAYEYDVFISYSHKDEDWVLKILLPTLEHWGLKVCIDYRDFMAGKPAIINMQDAVEMSRHTLLVLTPRWVDSEWTLYESILSRTDDPAGMQRRTIPFLLEKCTPPKFISMLSWVDFTNKKHEKEAWENLFKSLQISGPIPEISTPDTGGLPAGSYIPFPQNVLFTGREVDLKSLADNLLKSNSTNTVISQAVTGMGGLGKTQLAVEFAYRYGYRFKGMHWLDLRDVEALDGAIALCGTKMGYSLVNQPDQVAATIKAWIEDGPRLLILDNFEEVKKAHEVLAVFQHPSLRLLITSRRKDFPKSTALHVQELGLFSGEESLDFLEKTLEQAETRAARKALADKLGHLPLALELAANYININHTGIEEYVRDLEDILAHESMQAEWFKELDVTSPTKHDLSLFGTFQLSWREVKEETQQNIFMLAGYLAPNTPIPLEIFKKTLELEDKDVSKALYRLNALGLLPVADHLASIHPLLAAYARTLSSKELLEKLADQLAELAKRANDQVDQTGNLVWFVPLRQHILAAAEFAGAADV